MNAGGRCQGACLELSTAKLGSSSEVDWTETGELVSHVRPHLRQSKDDLGALLALRLLSEVPGHP